MKLFLIATIAWFAGALYTWRRPFWYKVDLLDLDYADEDTWEDLREEFEETHHMPLPGWVVNLAWSLVRLGESAIWPHGVALYYRHRLLLQYRAWRLRRRR